MPGNKRGKRGRGRGRGSNNVMPVANTVFLVEPSAVIPISVRLSTGNDVTVELPSYLNGTAWRVTSVDLSFATSNAVATIIIRLFGAVTNATTSSATEITARSRPFLVTNTIIQVKMRNGRNVQHGATGPGVPIVQFGVADATVNIDGIVNLSVKGGI
jgi:hypothetical protein